MELYPKSFCLTFGVQFRICAHFFTLSSTSLTSYFCIFVTPQAHFPRFSFENETIVTFRATKSTFNIRQTE